MFPVSLELQRNPITLKTLGANDIPPILNTITKTSPENYLFVLFDGCCSFASRFLGKDFSKGYVSLKKLAKISNSKCFLSFVVLFDRGAEDQGA